MVKKRTIIIKKRIIEDGKEITDYIRKESYSNSQKFKKEVEIQLLKIIDHPTAFPPEQNLPTSKNWYRFAIVMKSWKIIFKVTSKVLVFLGIVHVKRNPNEIKKLRTSKYE